VRTFTQKSAMLFLARPPKNALSPLKVPRVCYASLQGAPARSTCTHRWRLTHRVNLNNSTRCTSSPTRPRATRVKIQRNCARRARRCSLFLWPPISGRSEIRFGEDSAGAPVCGALSWIGSEENSAEIDFPVTRGRRVG